MMLLITSTWMRAIRLPKHYTFYVEANNLLNAITLLSGGPRTWLRKLNTTGLDERRI